MAAGGGVDIVGAGVVGTGVVCTGVVGAGVVGAGCGDGVVAAGPWQAVLLKARTMKSMIPVNTLTIYSPFTLFSC